jgi:peptidoglycan/LPS O-acetylase OafA/YrhL
MSKAMTSLKYRTDIDGLRAVAVLGVVIYHAFPGALPGGFTGVDIFFVISGYLISGILYKRLKANGEDGNVSPFSFREFYARRIRRLFPALITMLVITLAYGWLILLPDEFQQLGKHVAAGTFFIQNIVFWQESGYFDISANLKPLLHLWSLAVEEQFYIFFPPLLVLLWKKPKILVPAMVVMLIATFILNVVMSVQNSVSDFFLTPYRAWEFLGGSMLAWWHYDKGHQYSEGEDVPPYREVLSWCGVILLALGFAFIHTGDPYPGWRALLPVAGTLMLMEGGAGGLKGAWVNRKILSNPAVVWIGLISYPLYLFHWPALSFVHIVKGESPKLGYIIGALLVSFVLTMLTYYFIEKKIRHNKAKWTIPALVAAFLITGLLGYVIYQKELKARLSGSLLQEYSQASQEHNFFDGFSTSKFSDHIWLHEAGGRGAKTLYIGDSHAQQCMPRILELLKSGRGKDRATVFLTIGLVVPIPGATGPLEQAQQEMTKGMEELGYRRDIDRIVVSANWKYFFGIGGDKYSVEGMSLGTPKGTQKGVDVLMDQLGKFVRAGKKTSLILSIPTSPALDPKNIIERGFDGSFSINQQDPDLKELLAEKTPTSLTHGEVMEMLSKAASRVGVEVIDPVPMLSTNGICPLLDDQNRPIYCDQHHLRSSYVRNHASYLDKTILP